MNKEPVDYQKRILTIPNILSFFRILLIPAIVWMYCVEQDHIATAWVVVLSGLTDIVDGFIARRFHMISDLGKALDPVADKLTQAAMLLCLFTNFPLMLIPFVLMFIKETISAAASLMAIRKTGQVVGANWHGKVNTCLLYAMMTLHILWPDIPDRLSQATILVCTVMMLISFALYVLRHLRVLRAPDHSNV